MRTYLIRNISINAISTTLLGCPGPGQPENTTLYYIIVDNKSATDNYKNILFLPDKKYGFKKRALGRF
jgi:hypothetical protein